MSRRLGSVVFLCAGACSLVLGLQSPTLVAGDPDGGGATDGGTDALETPTSLAVVATTPAADATDADRDAPVTITFSLDVEPASLESTTIRLLDSDGDSVALTLAYDPGTRTLSLGALAPLVPEQRYTISIGATVMSTSGLPLAEQFTRSFVVASRRWRQGVLVSASGVNPQVGVDAQGNANVIWQDLSPSPQRLVSRRFLAATGWEDEVVIATGQFSGGPGLTPPQMATNEAGQAMVVWLAQVGGRTDLWASFRNPALGWSTPELLELNDADNTLSPDVGIDADGNAVVVWLSRTSGLYHVQGRTYTVDVGWEPSDELESNAVTNSSSPSVAVHATGHATAVWVHPGTRANGTLIGNIAAAEYTPGSGWQPHTLIENDNNNYASDPQVSIGVSDTSSVVWKMDDSNGHPSIWANRRTSGSWATAQVLENGAATVGDVRIASDSRSEAVIAMFLQSNGTTDDLWAAKWGVGGWQAAGLVETETTAAKISSGAFAQPGKAHVVWTQSDGNNDNVWGNFSTATTPWANARVMQNSLAGAVGRTPTLAMTSDGDGFAVWSTPLPNSQSIIHLARFR